MPVPPTPSSSYAAAIAPNVVAAPFITTNETEITMAKLPGLTRHDDHPSVDGTSKGRLQVRNPIGSVGLQPQARPVDTYSRPQAPNSGPNDFMQLASALASVSPSLQSFIQNSEQRAKKDAEDRAMRRIGGMSFEEAKAAVDGGKMTEMDNPWFKAAYMKQYGERLAYQRINELTAEYETNFDKDKGSFDQFVRERAKEDLEKYGNDPHFTSAYNQLIDNYSAKANQAQAQHRAEQTKLDTVSGVYDTFMGQAHPCRWCGDGEMLEVGEDQSPRLVYRRVTRCRPQAKTTFNYRPH